MGTRSLTVFLDDRDKDIVVLSRHWDGSLDGHGAQLAAFLAPFTVGNGLGAHDPDA
jgi:hypothetical protein